MPAWLLICLAACFAPLHLAYAQSQSITAHLGNTLGWNEAQVHVALGTLLVYAREHLAKPEFDQLAKRMPNADFLMQQARSSGTVTRPIDDRDEYEAALANMGVGPQSIAQFAPAVLEYMAAAGYYQERDILSRVLD